MRSSLPRLSSVKRWRRHAAARYAGHAGYPDGRNVAIRNSPWQGVRIWPHAGRGQALQSVAGQIGGLQQERLTAAAPHVRSEQPSQGQGGSGPFEA